MATNFELFFVLPDLVFFFSLILLVLLATLTGPAGIYALSSGIYPKFHLIAGYQTFVSLFFALIIKLELISLQGTAFWGSFVFTGITNIAQILTIVFGLLIVIYVLSLDEQQSLEFWIFITLFLYANYAIVASGDLLVAFLFFELQSFNSYALIALARHRVLSLEAALKYFLVGTVGSIFFLLTICLSYFFLGTTSLTEIFLLSLSLERPIFIIAAMVPFMCALLLKLSAFPFHMWAPDVYSVLRTPVLSAFSVLPKISFWFFFLVALLPIIISTRAFEGSSSIFYLGVAGVVFGSLAAFRQESLQRFVAYSGVANMGYCVCALISATGLTYFSVMLYAFSYSIIGLTLLLLAAHPSTSSITLQGVKDRAITNPAVGFFLIIALLTMAGFPPFIGFFAKYGIIVSLWGGNFVYFSALLALLSALGSVYYVVMAADIYFYPVTTSNRVAAPVGKYGSLRAFLLSGLVLVNCFWLFFYPLVESVLRNALLS